MFLLKLKAETIHLLPGESFRLLQWQNNIHDAEVVAADGSRRPFEGSGHEWHYHSQMELTLVVQGSGTRFIGDAITHVKAPDLVLIGPDLPHAWHLRHHTSGYAIQFDFPPRHPFWLFPETCGLSALWKEAQRGLHFSGPAVSDVADLIRASLGCGGLGRLARFMRILETLAQTEPRHRKAISGGIFAPPARLSTYRSLQKAIDLVFNRFQDELTFSDVLSETRMSKATFERHFKRHTGKTFTQFLAEIRLNFASRQLMETDLSVSEIALASGFNNISHFNHQFRSLHHLSPRAFRKAMTHANG